MQVFKEAVCWNFRVLVCTNVNLHRIKVHNENWPEKTGILHCETRPTSSSILSICVNWIFRTMSVKLGLTHMYVRNLLKLIASEFWAKIMRLTFHWVNLHASIHGIESFYFNFGYTCIVQILY